MSKNKNTITAFRQQQALKPTETWGVEEEKEASGGQASSGY